MNTARVLLISTLSMLVGCATAGTPSSKPTLDGASAANSVVLCKTTLAELQARLGSPTRDGLLHSGRIVSWVTEWEPLARYLAVLANQQGVVTDLYWNVPTEIPWVPIDQCHNSR